jgi:hypothetical protein
MTAVPTHLWPETPVFSGALEVEGRLQSGGCATQQEGMLMLQLPLGLG